MNYDNVLEILKSIGQEHLLKHWNSLNAIDQQNLLAQIANLNLDVFKQQQKIVHKDSVTSDTKLETFSDFSLAGNADDRATGKQLLSEGKAGCLLVAGGQGTRLNFNAPKGLFPISIIKHKTLFQLFAEKTVAASKQANKLLPLAIMTAPSNDHIIREFFQKNGLFGLDSSQLYFFCQGMLPFLNREGNLLLKEPDTIAFGPDGNGKALHYFVEQNVWQQWKEQGVSMVNFVLIDNPLADPFDAELIGFHYRKKDEVTVKCVLRRDAGEKVGLLVKKDNKTQVIEYSEILETERLALSEGQLKHACANISLFCFNMDFIKRISTLDLLLHKALKETSAGEKAWKFETFIFDLLPMANKVHALLYPRELCFAPLKNKSGADSPATVQEALLKQARDIYSQVTGNASPNYPFELAADFYYPTEILLHKWKGAFITQTYIEP